MFSYVKNCLTWLEVPVDKVVEVEKLGAFQDLLHNEGSLEVREVALLFYHGSQAASLHVRKSQEKLGALFSEL